MQQVLLETTATFAAESGKICWIALAKSYVSAYLLVKNFSHRVLSSLLSVSEFGFIS